MQKRLFLQFNIWYNLSMSTEKLTREKLNHLEKDMLITLLLGMQEQLAQQTANIEKLTEQILLMSTRTFGKKSEKNLLNHSQLNFFDEIFDVRINLVQNKMRHSLKHSV